MNNNNFVWTVYKHTSPSGKSYIGITSKKVIRRWGKSGNGYKSSTLFWKAIQKYGWDAFTHDILETNLSEQEAFEREKFYIQKYNSHTPNGYNLSLGGESGSFGYHHTEETKKIIAEASRIGGFKGHHHTKESNEKNRIAHLGKKNPHDENWRKKVSVANTGKKRTDEQIEKMKNARQKNFHHTEETKQRISETCKRKNIAKNLFRDDVRKQMLEKKRIKIIQEDKDGNIIKEFSSLTECAKYFNVSVSLISMMTDGKHKTKNNRFNLRRT